MCCLQVADQAVFGNQVQVPTAESQPSAARSSAPEALQAQLSPNHDSAERRVVQRISSQSTPQNPAGPSQPQPSGLALAAAPVSTPAGVIMNQRQLSQEGIDSELPRTALARPGPHSRDDKQTELRSHPLTHTPSRKRSFTPSEASSSLDAPPSSNQDSMGASVGDGRSADGVRVEEGQR